ncbi:hypothetical protein PUN28_015718 [Cardiocondyla obscurior]|uniref:Uncharacterized protein n=1 Tax=Cardiocondyla obscurior TaxID=286306 RepID=A0AAW2EWP0_9HYME
MTPTRRGSFELFNFHGGTSGQWLSSRGEKNRSERISWEDDKDDGARRKLKLDNNSNNEFLHQIQLIYIIKYNSDFISHLLDYYSIGSISSNIRQLRKFLKIL